MYDIRPVDLSDVSLISHHRYLMFLESGKSAEALEVAKGPFERWLTEKLESQAYFGFIAVYENKPVAGVGLMVIDWPPHPLHPLEASRGYVLNLYVEKDHRKKGLAGLLMEHARQAFEARGVAYAILHSTADAQAMYRKMGWSQTTEMGKELRNKPNS